MRSVGVFQDQLGFVAHCYSKYSSSCVQRINKFPSRQGYYPLRIASGFRFYPILKSISASSASSVSGSGAEYPEQLLDVERKKIKKRIAGIDQDELLDPKLLADPDSRFCEFKGVQIHHKVYDAESQAHLSLQTQTLSQHPQHPTKKLGFPMILLHGFGASVFSWNRVLKPLAEITCSKILAFDRPAFGLTSRVNLIGHSSSGTGDTKPLNPYSMAFSVLATLYFIDFLAAEKAILVGHSAGSLTAVNTYFEAPERVAALVLVAPAILVPLTKPKTVKEKQLGKDNQIEDDLESFPLKNLFLGLYKILGKINKYIIQAVMRMMKEMANMFNSLYMKLLSAILHSAFAVMLVRVAIDKFGIAAVRSAWYDSKKVTEHVLYGYTKPLRTKDWDRALVEYMAAMLLDTESKSNPPLSQRLHEISCPVLIVTGDSDRIVPSWNAERLSRAIPGSSLEVIKHCGHLPHEEKVEEFVAVVEKFLRKLILGDSNEQCLQASTWTL
ncbi:putative Alpha/beta hydrolase [Quillaja saponaria]|uniref:Alpha/beta hydrolase n=1 Tax=Quillaja saponaria TaxID=32244 RepID=A0AAD7LVV5_QUISA|nr:putative Alpha/beta hydrolase [Quillaja saponaria]